MSYSRTHYGTGYYFYQQSVPGAKLSQPIHSWSEKSVPDKDFVSLISRAGTDFLPPGDLKIAQRLHIAEESGHATLGSNTASRILTMRLNSHTQPGDVPIAGHSMLRALELSSPRTNAIELGRVRLRVTWDDFPQPSIDAPLALFFGAGTFYNRDNREYLVKAFPVNVRFEGDRVRLASFFPMPFFESARIELINPGETPLDVQWSVRIAPFKGAPGHVGYFHATYRDHPNPIPGQDLVLLDTRQTEGGGRRHILDFFRSRRAQHA